MAMRWLVVLMCLLMAGAERGTDGSDEQARIVARIEKMEGWVAFDKRQPGTPVVEVILYGRVFETRTCPTWRSCPASWKPGAAW